MVLSQIIDLFSDYTFQVVAIGSIALGVLSGTTGVFAVLRKQSLLGDSIAHSSLAGVAIAFIITQNKNTEVLLLGALVIGLISTYITGFFSRNTRINFESSMALVMASFFGLGLILLTQIQKSPNSNQAGLNRFLFGQAATILARDVYLTLGVAAVVLITMLLLWKELKLYTFDPVFAQTSGFNVKFLNVVLSSFIVASVIMGIQMVGVVLMSALLIAPAVSARQWTKSLSSMVILAAILGGISGLTGTVISSTISKFPTGPAIVLVASIFVIISILFAPGRGLIQKRAQQRYAQLCFESEMILIHYFSHHNHTVDHVFTVDQLYQDSIREHNISNARFKKMLKNLQHRNLIEVGSMGTMSVSKSAYGLVFDKEVAS